MLSVLQSKTILVTPEALMSFNSGLDTDEALHLIILIWIILPVISTWTREQLPNCDLQICIG